MRVKAKNRVLIAWVLFMTLMPFFVVKAIHHHEEISICHSDDAHSQNSCEKCPICHFTLSPFMRVESLDSQVIIPLFSYEQISYVNMLTYQLNSSHDLRAPPYLI